MAILVLDVGTSGVRAAIVGNDARIVADAYRETLPDCPAAGLVEFDAAAYADTAIGLAEDVLATRTTAIDAVGISNQRASAIVWDRATGRPVAPAQGWQDLRTLGTCLVLQAEGFRFAPNQTATKIADIWDSVDPDRTRDLCVGTPDSWLIWCLSGGAAHVTDLSNAAITGLMRSDAIDWDDAVLERLRIPRASLPRIVDSSGFAAHASRLSGAPPICGVAGDQQASLVGQAAVRPGLAKITFGTGGMLDVCTGTSRPSDQGRAATGTFPIVCWRRGDEVMWGYEAIMLSAGTNVQWLRDDLGIIADAAESAAVAAQCDSTDGVMYVPAQLGLGTPRWDYGARGTLLGLTRGTGRAQVVRAVLEGVAHRGADLIDAAESDSGTRIESLRVDGGMAANRVFVQALADVSGRPIEIAPVKDATSVGAALLAGLEVGLWDGWDDIAGTWEPAAVIDPTPSFDRIGQRDRWGAALDRAAGWFGELSALDF
ncbi:MAG TPA: FGGY-family carbohydrate kinase [Microthrixaceae bacterium]|jgi:glycerol kinase|nr:FGGY-family carbohydrate kinase [Microthrixaceae bacterium]HMT25936.1 FGGY-family carbohydrate kinase [Microthrixaceae bacterium]HMT61384.1 FGGY-family carbohydrate kinase [Microthrixaceae bacterium]